MGVEGPWIATYVAWDGSARVVLNKPLTPGRPKLVYNIGKGQSATLQETNIKKKQGKKTVSPGFLRTRDIEAQ